MPEIFYGIVTDNVDTENLGRVQVKLHHFSGEITLPWLRVLQPFASAGFGVVCLPEIDDHVLVMHGPGGPESMIVMGSLYTATRTPPMLNAESDVAPLRRGMLTVGGTEVVIDDTEGAELIAIRTPEAKLEILLDQAEPKLRLYSENVFEGASDAEMNLTAADFNATATDSMTLTLDGSGTLKIEGGTVEIKGSTKVKIDCADIELG